MLSIVTTLRTAVLRKAQTQAHGRIKKKKFRECLVLSVDDNWI